MDRICKTILFPIPMYIYCLLSTIPLADYCSHSLLIAAQSSLVGWSLASIQLHSLLYHYLVMYACLLYTFYAYLLLWLSSNLVFYNRYAASIYSLCMQSLLTAVNRHERLGKSLCLLRLPATYSHYNGVLDGYLQPLLLALSSIHTYLVYCHNL